MDLRDFVIRSMDRARLVTVELVRDLTPQELLWQPGPKANHVAFLLFHIFRVEDSNLHAWVTEADQVWEEESWSDPIVLPSPDASHSQNWTTGNGWTSKEVGGWEPPPLEKLLAYGAAVRRVSVERIRALDLERLEEIPRPDRPTMAIRDYLNRASHHEVGHNAQIDYLLELMRAAP